MAVVAAKPKAAKRKAAKPKAVTKTMKIHRNLLWLKGDPDLLDQLLADRALSALAVAGDDRGDVAGADDGVTIFAEAPAGLCEPTLLA